ncbi:uncharacterized protein LOC118434173 isoform X2 [Folsomia candida]|uniref:Uncharacterized protein n=2 Tax=Folsomia candida TaxID=158441 RepID=A0A226EWT2_FOLCA|nr:uncharacterized protein LOC118434173 isoform X2 [Folsomia candida]OXA61524.1 hypothetical protein Fcan01_01556 [Folsomia candida]
MSVSPSTVRQPRTVKGNELNMQNLPSCISRIICMMNGSEVQSGSKNEELLKKLMKNLIKGDAEESSEEENDDDDDDENSAIITNKNILDNNQHIRSYRSRGRPIYKSDSLEKLVNEYDGFFSRRVGPPSKRYPRLFGSFNPFMKIQKKGRYNPADLHKLRTALKTPRSRSSRQCNSRLLKLTLIRNNYPPTSSTPISVMPPSQEACPFNFSELQTMLLDTFGSLLMTAGGIGGALAMAQPSPKEQQNQKVAEMGGANQQQKFNDTTSIYNNGNPYTVYANIKLPITISASEQNGANAVGTDLQKVNTYHYRPRPSTSNQIAQNNNKNRQPILVQKLSDFYKRNGKYKSLQIGKQSQPKIGKLQHAKNEQRLKASEESSISEESEENLQNLNIYNIQKIESNNIPIHKISSDLQMWIRWLRRSMANLQRRLLTKFQPLGAGGHRPARRGIFHRKRGLQWSDKQVEDENISISSEYSDENDNS